MSDSNYSGSNRPEQEEPSTGQRINEALNTTGQRLSEEVNMAGERLKQFAEEKRLNEQLEVAGNQVVDRVRGLIEEGNVRRLILRNSDGRTLIEIPLTAGVVVGGAVAWFNPLLAGLGAIAALVTRITIEIVRDEPEATKKDIQDAAKDVQQRLSGGGSGGMGGGSGSSGGSGGTGGGSGTGGSANRP
jgi:uncharacterized membrane protein YgcG